MEFNQINLTTHDHVDRRVVLAILGGAAVLLVIFTLANAIGGWRAYREQSAFRSKIRDLQQQAQTLAAAQGEDDGTYDPKIAESLQQRSRQANRLIALDVFPWGTVLDEIEKAVPEEILIERFLPAPDLKSIHMIGATASVEPITRFQETLGKSGLFQSVVLENMDLGGRAKADAPPAGEGAIQFDLICSLNLQAILPEDLYGGLWMTLDSATTGQVSRRQP